MSALFAAALLLQIKAGVTQNPADTTKKDVSVGVTVGRGSDEGRPPKRIPVTAEHVRTAFRTPLAKSTLERARATRMAQDSALMSYEATAYLRVSAGMGFSRIGRERLIFRHENVTHVRWHRDVGAWIDVAGARTALPVAAGEGEKEVREEMAQDGDMTPVPYYPGQEPLMSFNGGGVVKSQVDERDMVHPLAEGAEAYYTYAVGDSVAFRLPDGRTVQLRELHVRPREPKWNVVVGSLWFDAAGGQLVRAAYRLAIPMDIWAVAEEQDSAAREEIPIWVKPLISPMRAQVTAIVVEYGLHQGRFWLPRMNHAEGHAQVSFMRVPFKFEQSFRYSTVNALEKTALPEIKLPATVSVPKGLSDSAAEQWRDSVREVRRAQRRAVRDSVRLGLRKDPNACDSSGVRTQLSRRQQEGGMPVAVRVPCDTDALARSPELPKSIYDEGEEIFGSRERDALIAEALSLGAQPGLGLYLSRPTLKYGMEYTRFNRIEGFSTGVQVDQLLGAGYAATLFGRLGHADLEPNVELSVSRTNLAKTIRLRGYNRLVAANDWGNPLSFGSSLSALLFGRDEGFYYRSSGAELEWVKEEGAVFSWRAFAERQRSAAAENSFTLGPAFIANIAASTRQFAGVSARVIHTKGLDPHGFRLFTDVRVEAAASDSSGASFGRGALELTFTDAFGPVAAALTASAGSSVGGIPPQRRFYLGGAHTVRGQRADTSQTGNAYWLGRLELGTTVTGVRPTLFGDIGWAGDRARIDQVGELEIGRPMSGAGLGVSMVDGLIRFDVAKGIYPRKRVRVDMYVEARF